MASLRALAADLLAVLRWNGVWMTWNLLLACIPAVLAALVFRHRGQRTVLWWLGLGLFVLFLPNAPYLITDLVHLRGDVMRAGDDAAVVTAVLPVYGGLIGVGLLAYTVSLLEMGRYLRWAGWASRRAAIEVGVHGLCAVGVVLGRVARLNSWEPVTEPSGTVERVVLTLSARWAVLAAAVLFVIIWAAHAVTRTVLLAAADGLARALARLQRVVFAGPA